jgi:predicted DNA-binding transcriptional regulator AlpA
MEKSGKLPKSIKIGEKSMAWRESDIEEWLKNGGAK